MLYVKTQPTFRRNISLSFSSTLKTRRHIPPKIRLTFNRLHGALSQNIQFFIAIFVRILNPIFLYVIYIYIYMTLSLTRIVASNERIIT
jgi:hypothetical protein